MFYQKIDIRRSIGLNQQKRYEMEIVYKEIIEDESDFNFDIDSSKKKSNLCLMVDVDHEFFFNSIQSRFKL